MPYSPDEQYLFYTKDAKTNISILTQSAFNKAVDLVIALGFKDGDDAKTIREKVFFWRDTFFQDNQEKIEQEYNSFIELNTIEKWYQEKLKLEQQMKQAQEEGIPTIQENQASKPLF